ncbi:hypothetical protein EDB85DRAFT_1056170 [Lactarius pseudohatsudake]|nr:hypothetical protein EDB85DRAFT_1056170 [Lactarius pseudohatsudake]
MTCVSRLRRLARFVTTGVPLKCPGAEAQTPQPFSHASRSYQSTMGNSAAPSSIDLMTLSTDSKKRPSPGLQMEYASDFRRMTLRLTSRRLATQKGFQVRSISKFALHQNSASAPYVCCPSPSISTHLSTSLPAWPLICSTQSQPHESLHQDVTMASS